MNYTTSHTKLNFDWVVYNKMIKSFKDTRNQMIKKYKSKSKKNKK